MSELYEWRLSRIVPGHKANLVAFFIGQVLRFKSVAIVGRPGAGKTVLLSALPSSLGVSVLDEPFSIDANFLRECFLSSRPFVVAVQRRRDLLRLGVPVDRLGLVVFLGPAL